MTGLALVSGAIYLSFQPWKSRNINAVFVIRSDLRLWLKRVSVGNVLSPAHQIGANVSTFQALDLEHVFVLDTNGNLSFEQAPVGNSPPIQIDSNVKAFQSLDLEYVLVLGVGGDQRLEHAPFGNIPPGRILIDANVKTFQALNLEQVLVLGIGGNLWLEHAPFGNIPPGPILIDSTVQAFQVPPSNSSFFRN